MTQASLETKRVTEVLNRLETVYGIVPAPLNHRSPFELLIAVILSAQCTDARVNSVTPNLFPIDRPLEPQDLLKMGEERVKKIIFSCGYHNQKTRALLGSAEALLNRPLPQTLEELTQLPGVGRKTAQVVLAQAFGADDAFPVDTHVHRLCNRLNLAKSGKNRELTERQVRQKVPADRLSELHLQLIEHGRKICTARNPNCKACPLNDICPSSKVRS